MQVVGTFTIVITITMMMVITELTLKPPDP